MADGWGWGLPGDCRIVACSEQEGEVIIIGRITRVAEAKGYHRETEGENGESRNPGTEALLRSEDGGVVG